MMEKFSLINFYYAPTSTGDYVTCLLKTTDGQTTSVTIPYYDYFYVRGTECNEYLRKNNWAFEVVQLLDMSNPKHLTIGKEPFSKVFYPVVNKTKKSEFLQTFLHKYPDQCFEYDLDLQSKIAMDYSLYIGRWYTLEKGMLALQDSLEIRPKLKSLVFDLETCKKPFLFPNAEEDEIMSIAALFGEEGFVFVNLTVFNKSDDRVIYMGANEMKNKPFEIVYCETERQMLSKFVKMTLEQKCDCWIGYNSDNFDLPYLETRCAKNDINFKEQFGFQKYKTTFVSRKYIHLDLIYWVMRDSYLPMGKRRLKDVARSKLQFEADDVDPELMMKLALEAPHTMLHYNISDIVATYLLNQKFVENFIFALGSIVPLTPDNLLRKGTGSICDTGMLALAKKTHIKIENKPPERSSLLFKDYVCKSETYVGGSVESTVIGIHNGNHKADFKISVEDLEKVKQELPDIVAYNCKLEGIEDVQCMDETVSTVRANLNEYIQKHLAEPNQPYKIYHFDVKAMYPSIILTYRLQPHAIRPTPTCEDCQEMRWTWKGDVFNMTREEYERLLPDSVDNLTKACKAYVKEKRRKPQIKHLESLEPVYVCQRENPFFVDVVENIKNMRDHFKTLLRVEKQTTKDAQKILLYDNLQLSYKCILNSCYGWLKMYGNRWGNDAKIVGAIVCQWAREIIMAADDYLDKFSKRINRDTDGTFRRVPANLILDVPVKTTKNVIVLNLLNCMLNMMLYKKFTNRGYIHENQKIEKNLLSFEVDGPYPMMYLPGSNNSQSVKKKYVVFNDKEEIQEIKGLEVIRRGEWSLLKKFQEGFFKALSHSSQSSILEFYDELKHRIVAPFDNVFLTKGEDLSEAELLEYFEQTKVASKSIDDYKSISAVQTAIRRWGELNDNSTFGSLPGTQCGFIISKYPESVPQISNRVIPTAVFSKSTEVRNHFLKLWTQTDVMDLKNLLDWDYYTRRWIMGRDRAYTVPRKVQCPENPDTYPLQKKRRRSNVKKNAGETSSDSSSNSPPIKRAKQAQLTDFYKFHFLKSSK